MVLLLHDTTQTAPHIIQYLPFRHKYLVANYSTYDRRKAQNTRQEYNNM